MRIAALLLAVCLIFTIATTVDAAEMDPIDQFALEFFRAVEEGKQQFQTTVQMTDIDALLHQVFDRYPILFYYYYSYSGNIYPTYAEVSFELQDVSVPWQDIYIVDSDETLKAVLGLGLAQLRTDIHFMTIGGYSYSVENVDVLLHEIMTETYLGYMGYHGTNCSYSSWDDGMVSRYDLTFLYWDDMQPAEIQQWRDATEEQALYLATNLFALDMPDYRKELLIHDWLVNNNEYNIKDMDDPASHMAYGALVQGTCVCQGYAEAMMLLAQAAGIPCKYIPGEGITPTSTESHGWNCIQIDGQWYMLDVTWDDPVTDGEPILQYTYFNVTSEKLAEDHLWDRANSPECTATAMNIDTVQQLCQNDTTDYFQYSSENLITQEMAAEKYMAQLQNAKPVVPTVSTLPEEVPTQDATEPQELFRPQETQPQIQPEIQPQNPPQLPDFEVPTPEGTNETQENDAGWVIVVAIVVLVAGGAVAFLVIKKKREEEAMRRRKVFDPTVPFDENRYRF